MKHPRTPKKPNLNPDKAVLMKVKRDKAVGLKRVSFKRKPAESLNTAQKSKLSYSKKRSIF